MRLFSLYGLLQITATGVFCNMAVNGQMHQKVFDYTHAILVVYDFYFLDKQDRYKGTSQCFYKSFTSNKLHLCEEVI